VIKRKTSATSSAKMKSSFELRNKSITSSNVAKMKNSPLISGIWKSIK